MYLFACAAIFCSAHSIPEAAEETSEETSLPQNLRKREESVKQSTILLPLKGHTLLQSYSLPPPPSCSWTSGHALPTTHLALGLAVTD